MKYKLIKWYPSLPKDLKVGIIVTQGARNYINDTFCILVSQSEVENNPEFWEKVVEKDYEILEIRGEYGAVSSYMEELDYDLKDKTIFKIKRLSDGEIFTVGDKVRYYFNKKSISKVILKIGFEKIGKCPEQLFIYTDGEQSTINHYVKADVPLFTTEDGVDIYKGDDCWGVRDNFTIYQVNTKYDCWGVRDNFTIYQVNTKYDLHYKHPKTFSTRKNAEEYILMNKPCLSINDVLSVGYRVIVDEGKLKRLVSQKIK